VRAHESGMRSRSVTGQGQVADGRCNSGGIISGGGPRRPVGGMRV